QEKSVLTRYSRLIVLFGISFSCVAVNVWLLMTGHNRLPGLVFVVCLVSAPLILRKLPPVTTNRHELRNNQLKAVKSMQQLGWIYVAGLILGILTILSGGTKDVPLRPVLIGVSISALLIWHCFAVAKRVKQAASKTEKPTIEKPQTE